MSTQCSILLLSTTLLAIVYRAVGDAEVIPFFRLPNNFTWSHVGAQEITLRWDVQDLGEHFADQIKITASPDGVSIKNETVDYSREEVTLVGLEANWTYEVTVEAIKDGRSVKHYFDEVETLPSVEAEIEQTMHTSTPRNYVSAYIGAEESVATTSGSASTRVISSLALAYMAVVLA